MKNKILESSLNEQEQSRIRKSFISPLLGLIITIIFCSYLSIAAFAVIMSSFDNKLYRTGFGVISGIILLYLIMLPIGSMIKKMKDLKENKKLIIRGSDFRKGGRIGLNSSLIMNSYYLAVPRSFYRHVHSKDLLEIHITPYSHIVLDCKVIR
ncbi:MAG: hypothetical protein ACJ75J_06845 [Cytophagaceae bacterium]